jgi:hypothetical protein
MLYTRFDLNTSRFPGETKEDAVEIARQIEEAEAEVARLQSVLTRYNVSVNVTFFEQTMTIMEATRLIGALGRLEKRWRTWVCDTSVESTGRFGTSNERDMGKVYREHTLSFDERSAQHARAESRVRALRLALDTANAIPMDV